MKAFLRSTFVLAGLLSVGALAFSQTEDFWTKFQVPYGLGDMEGMKKTILKDPPGCINAFFARVERFAVDGDEEMGKQVDAMREAWKATYNNQFFETQYKYLSYLDAEGRRRRQKMIDGWWKMRSLYDQTRGSSKEENWESLEKNLGGLVESMEQTGEYYYGSWCAYFLGQSYDPQYRPKGNNARLALDFYRRFLEFRERIDLKDGDYASVKSLVEKLEKIYKTPKNDGGGGTSEPGADGGTIPFKEGSQWIPVPMASAIADLVNEPERYAYDADEIAMTWQKVSVQTGKPSTLPGFDGKTVIVREGAVKYHLDADGDGKRQFKLKAIGKPELIEFPRPHVAAEDKYAFYLTVGGQSEIVQKVQANAAPTNEFATFYCRSAAARTGDFQGTAIKMYDENADGKFNAEVVDRIWEGTEIPLPLVDSWAIGKEKRVIPASAYAKFADKWYRVEIEPKNTGLEMKMREVDGNTATLVMDYKGPPSLRPSFLLVKAVGIYTGGIFDIASNPKGVQVPAGGYEILYGLIRTGKSKSIQKMAILHGASKGVTVEPGQTASIKVGEPFGLEFSHQVAEGKLRVPGKSVYVTGAGGERYELIWDEIPTPELQLRANGKPMGKPIEMKRAAQADLNKASGWDILWHPLDIEYELHKEVEKLEAKLSQKHKWFGKLESAWK